MYFKLFKLALNKKMVLSLLWVFFLILLQVAADVTIPFLLTYLNKVLFLPINDHMFPTITDPQLEAGIIGSIMIVIALFSLLIGFFMVKYSSKLVGLLGFNIRNILYSKIQTFSLADLDKFKSSSLITRLTNDISLITNAYIFTIRTLVRSISIYIGSAIAIFIISSYSNVAMIDVAKKITNNEMLFTQIKEIIGSSPTNVDSIIGLLYANGFNQSEIDAITPILISPNAIDILLKASSYPSLPGWTIPVTIIAISMGLLISVLLLSAPAIPHFMKTQKATDNVNLVMQEDVIGQRVVKAFNLQESQNKRFSYSVEQLRKSATTAGLWIFTIMPTIYFFLDIAIVIVTWIVPGSLLASISSIMVLLSLMLSSMIMCIVVFVQIARAQSSSKRIMEVLNYEPVIKFKKEPANIFINDPSIIINELSFKYDNNSDSPFVLKDINLSINARSFTGIIGSTGSGKTTLVNLITRMYDISNGSIEICKTNIKELNKDQMRSLISYCPQNIILFSGTIRSNLEFGKTNASEKEMIDACKTSQAWSFIETRADQLDSIVEQRGSNFSGGQKQRIAIARSLIKESPILILDDSTSALDMLTEKEIQHSLLKQENKQTIIMVAQRISSVKNCDKIIVLEKGRVVGYDSHINLLKNCETYYNIALSQMGKEELDNEIATN